MGEATLREALEDYRTVYMAYRNFADRTREEYSNDLQGLVEFAEKLGIRNVGGLRLPVIERFVTSLEQEGFSSLTRKRKVVVIRSFLLFLYQDNYITTNIASKVILPLTETAAPHVLTPMECEELRSCTENSRDRAIIEILLATGIRLSELVQLTLNDIHLGEERGPRTGNGGFIRVLGGRRQSERIVPLNEKACMAITTCFGERQKGGGNSLFLNRFGEPLGERGVQKVLRKYLRKARIRSASIHTLRHTFAVSQLKKGIKPKDLKEIMGLRDGRSTGPYLALAAERCLDMEAK